MIQIKKVILLWLPPILSSLILNFRNKLSTAKNGFSGPYKSFDEVLDEGVWTSDAWLQLSVEKLDNLAIPTKKANYDYHDILVVFLNSILTVQKKLSILDWGGGAGFIWFLIQNQLSSKEVDWTILDNGVLTALGKKYSQSSGIPIRYIDSLNSHPEYDVLFINTSMQYVDDFQSLLEILLKSNPKYIVLTRLLRSDGNTIILKQMIHGKSCACVFISEKELLAYLKKNGFGVMYESPNWGERTSLYETLPAEVKLEIGIHPSKDFIFVKTN